MHAGSGNQISAVQRGMNELVAVLAHGAAKRAGVKRGFVGKSQQSAHVDADQFAGSDADHGGQRAVYAQNFVGFVVHHDEVGDGVKNFQPVAIGLFDAGEQAGIFQSHGGVAGNGFQQVAVFGRERAGASGEAEQAGEFSIGAGKTHDHAIIPA